MKKVISCPRPGNLEFRGACASRNGQAKLSDNPKVRPLEVSSVKYDPNMSQLVVIWHASNRSKSLKFDVEKRGNLIVVRLSAPNESQVNLHARHNKRDFIKLPKIDKGRTVIVTGGGKEFARFTAGVAPTQAKASRVDTATTGSAGSNHALTAKNISDLAFICEAVARVNTAEMPQLFSTLRQKFTGPTARRAVGMLESASKKIKGDGERKTEGMIKFLTDSSTCDARLVAEGLQWSLACKRDFERRKVISL